MNIITQMLEERWQALDDAILLLKTIVEEGQELDRNKRFSLVKKYGLKLLESQRLETALKILGIPEHMLDRSHRKNDKQ